jgi:guanine deaminase
MSEAFMREAIDLAIQTMRQGKGGPFGAVIVRDGVIISRGANEVTSSNDPTAHAEIVAIRRGCQHLGNFSLAGCDIYASCEPCPMCLSAIYWARIGRLFYAATRHDAATAGFDDEWIYQQIPLAVADRKLPCRQLLREPAVAAFSEWRSKPDKTSY